MSTLKNTDYRKKILAIVGPTATGKTDISVKLAQELGGEIISADSRLVYRDFNIGTAKPTPEERQGIPHHMIDVAEPQEVFTAGRFKNEAGDLLKQIPRPIVVGGTGFYIKALLQGLDLPKIEPDEDFRERMGKLSKEELNNKLRDADPPMADKIHPNNVFRVIRALEICHLTGKPASVVQSQSEPEYDVHYVGLNASDRDFLYERINQRVLKMIDNGLVKEVEVLLDKYGRTVALMNTLGYREICEHLDGVCGLEEAIEKIQKNTRNFAKRQLTWFRANNDINWFYIDEADQNEIVRDVLENGLI